METLVTFSPWWCLFHPYFLFWIGVLKSSMGELTDPTNRAEAYALMPVVWSLGTSMG